MYDKNVLAAAIVAIMSSGPPFLITPASRQAHTQLTQPLLAASATTLP
jgi:hypothetical protein